MSESSGTAPLWDAAYGHGDTTRSWFEPHAEQSLRLLDRCGVGPADSVIDVGGGASPLVDALLERGHTDLTVLDISAVGLDIARARLGARADAVTWVVADLHTWQPSRSYAVWHDRAVLHFLTADDARAHYVEALEAATGAGAVAVLATFAPDGPEQCSGLPVRRHDEADLAALLGDPWEQVAVDREEHVTPSGGVQPFTWAAFRRRA
ncbi:MAG TPA: class I SAM-dependent methyltransferase, partial [Humibacillus sp.]|nr:class I SAM-dependent methyltransferase [Humibacillus sp.]